MDLKYVKSLLKLFDESTATEITIEEEGGKIKLSKKTEKSRTEQQYVIPQQAPVNYSSAPSSAPAQAIVEKSASESTESAISSDLHEINSPIVGTFYNSPSPDADPFVKVGDRIEPGKTLCIIEAMKVMNEIESDVSGVVEKIMINNANPVEYNQVLFLIKAD